MSIKYSKWSWQAIDGPDHRFLLPRWLRSHRVADIVRNKETAYRQTEFTVPCLHWTCFQEDSCEHIFNYLSCETPMTAGTRVRRPRREIQVLIDQQGGESQGVHTAGGAKAKRRPRSLVPSQISPQQMNQLPELVEPWELPGTSILFIALVD